jgi:hypothetical protein
MNGLKIRPRSPQFNSAGKLVASCLAIAVLVIVVLAINLAVLAGEVWVVVKVLQAMRVL